MVFILRKFINAFIVFKFAVFFPFASMGDGKILTLLIVVQFICYFIGSCTWVIFLESPLAIILILLQFREEDKFHPA